MSDAVRGPAYARTLGRLLSYPMLASYLRDSARVPEIAEHLWDVPCGDGALLECLEEAMPDTELFGVDIAESQLKVARARTQRARFFASDILDLETVAGERRGGEGFCHIGFCFLNTFPEEERLALLRVLWLCKAFAYVGLEIQNLGYQKSTFRFGQWYRTSLPGGGTLHSKSEPVCGEHWRLMLRFEAAGSVVEVGEDLFEWALDDCLSGCNSVGWRHPIVLPATYRASAPENPSHFFIILQRPEVT